MIRPWPSKLVGRGAKPLGERGERVAARWLRKRGYRILERNLPVGDDEADLVALDPDGRTVVIVEVKTRIDSSSAPETAVNRTKQYRVARLAANLQKQSQYRDRPFRFDAIAVVWSNERQP